MSSDLIDEAKHMARVSARQRELVEEAADEIDECRAFAADRERHSADNLILAICVAVFAHGVFLIRKDRKRRARMRRLLPAIELAVIIVARLVRFGRLKYRAAKRGWSGARPAR